MFAISLIFSGIAMFLNGFLPLVDENDNNEIVVMNVISGIIVSILSLYGIFTAVTTATLLQYASLLLFGITHLYLASICIWDLSEESFGWFSALLTIIALGLGIYYLTQGSMLLGVMWLIWMFIWLAFFISRALDGMHTTACWVIMLIGVIGLTVAGFLLLTNFITLNFV